MPKLHGAECIRDEVVWFCHCVCYPDGWLMSVWEFVHVLPHYSCGLWSSVQKFVSGRYGRSGDVRLYCCVLGLRPEHYVTVPPMMCSPVRCTPSWFQVIALLYHRDQRILSAVVLNLRRCRVVSSHYSIILFYHRARSIAHDPWVLPPSLTSRLSSFEGVVRREWCELKFLLRSFSTGKWRFHSICASWWRVDVLWRLESLTSLW